MAHIGLGILGGIAVMRATKFCRMQGFWHPVPLYQGNIVSNNIEFRAYLKFQCRFMGYAYEF